MPPFDMVLIKVGEYKFYDYLLEDINVHEDVRV